MSLIQARTMRSLIEEKLPLRPISTGWLVGKCPLCGDYKERFGLRFDSDGTNQTISTNCWNCGAKSHYVENSGKVSRSFRRALTAHGIDDDEINQVVNSAFFLKKAEAPVITLEKLQRVNTVTPPVDLPPQTFQLGHPEHTAVQERLVGYLLERRVSPEKHRFFFSLEPRFKNRVIIPFYRNGALIYWQARSVDPAEKLRYENSPVSRDAVLFGFDQMDRRTAQPLFVTEGVFDALLVDGVALLGSKLNPAKTELLVRSARRLVFVIDKDKNGGELAREVLKLGWEIAFAPDGAEDLSESAHRFGMIWTAAELMKSIKSGEVAQLAINLNCR